MSELATVGIDLAKSVFQIHGVDETVWSLCGGSFAAANCLRSSRTIPGASSAWRLALVLMTGHASFSNWDMMSG